MGLFKFFSNISGKGPKRLSDNELIEKNLREAYKKCQKSLDGKLSKQEFHELFIKGLGMELTDFETRILFSLGKHDISGRLDFEEFLKIACVQANANFEFDVRLFCKNIFNDIDTNKNGNISLNEFMEASDLLPGILKLFKSNRNGKITKSEFEVLFNSKLNFTENEMQLFFYSLDVDSNGTIDSKEFLKLLKQDFEVDNDAYAKILFKMFDKDNNGLITFKEYRQMTKMDPSSTATDQEIKEDFEAIDSDENGVITLEELIESIRD